MIASECKSVAWGGLRFAIPLEWEPVRIGQRYLLFESKAGPAMEIKWEGPGGRPPKRRQLRRISRHLGRGQTVFRERVLPGGGDRRGMIDGIGFEWQSREQAAVGALLFCAVCRTTSLMQFFSQQPSTENEQQAAHVLGSFRDHRADGRLAWALYDVCAVLPGHFRMAAHRFDAGRFVLDFHGDRRRLSLYRWAPANVLLKKFSLAAFAAQLADGAGVEFLPLMVAGMSAVEALDHRPVSQAGRWQAVFRKPWYRGIRVWHVERRNRLLGIRLEARQPLTSTDLDEICDAYGMDDETEKKAALESI